MSTIPASAVVNVIPNVLSAGGNNLALNGLMLTIDSHVPFGVVEQFASPASVAAFFGASDPKASLAATYFAGFDNSTQKPGNLLMARWPEGGIAASLQSGNVAALGLAAIQAISSGTLIVSVDGYVRTASAVNLSTATSFTAAAALLQTDLNAAPATQAAFTASIAADTPAVVTASISRSVMTVTAVASGVLVPGMALTGTGVTAATVLNSQLSGTPGGVGTYAVSINQATPSTTVTGACGVMTVTAVGSGTLSVGQLVAGGTTTANTQITALGTGAGLTGTYYVNNSQVEVSGSLTTTGVPVAVSFDSVSGSFFITSGIVGAASSTAFATGTESAALLFTQATGATLSQGSPAMLPGAFMNGIVSTTQNWATLMTVFDPDGGQGNSQKQLFSAWVNSTNVRFAYLAWDTDITPTLSVPASSSLGSILQASNSSGTAPIYDPTNGPTIAAFAAGMVASIDFEATNGRITAAFKHQTGLVAGVTSQQIAVNLAGNPQVAGSYGNGYNFYGAYATANENFVFFNRGTISGPWLWLDSYVNAIWLTNELQLAILSFLTSVNSVPYNTSGYGLIEAACMDPINAALNSGVIRVGVTLSASQIAQINNAAGLSIAGTLQQQGWYLQIKDAAPTTRQGRASPPCTLWYTDGESVQAVTLNSVNVQ